ncbi:MAG: alpha/beta hydrolase-fold protein [Phycisphaerales bacterium]|nr:alpha/beta hydrolase-fold protein [Phycisphaerales bacterium]
MVLTLFPTPAPAPALAPPPSILALALAAGVGVGVVVVSPSAVLAQWVTPQVVAPRLQYGTFASVAAGTNVSYHIYTPPAYDAQPLRRWPVLYWLHGSGSATAGIAPMTSWFANAMSQGLMPPMLVVFANGLPYGMYCDAADGSQPVETVIVSELVPHIDATFRTIPARNGRIVEGFSMGGYGAARLAMRHGRTFNAFSILAAGPMQLDFPNAPPDAAIPLARRELIFADVWNSDPALMLAANPWTLAGMHATTLTRTDPLIRLHIGSADSTLAPNLDFHERLTNLNIAHTFRVLPGVGHSTIPLLTALGPSNWAFYHAALAPRCDAADIAGPNQSTLPLHAPGDGLYTADDIIVYLNWFFTAAPAADVAGPNQSTTPDGQLTADDIIVFLGRFFGGC